MKYRIQIILLGILATYSVFAGPLHAALVNVGDYNATVNASALNVRSGPSTGYRVIGTKFRNQTVTVTHHDGIWRKIIWSGGLNAYVHGSYLMTGNSDVGGSDINVTDYNASVNASSLNVRSGPGTNYSVIGSRYRNQTVRVTHHSGVWRRIAWYGGVGAYVHGNYLVRQNAQATRYDDIGRAACHNCYERKYANWITDALDSAKSIEIDFWDQDFGVPIRSQRADWYVGHYPNGNDNNCGGSLGTCLRTVKRWSDDNRNADVVTVYLDKKQGWSNVQDQRTPADLDRLILDIFGDRLYRPRDLKGRFASVRSAARNNGWRTRDQLKGKLIFVLTGGSHGSHNQTQHPYIQQRGLNASMFVAVDLDDQHDYTETPEHFSEETASYLVFYNLKEDNFNQAWIEGIRMRNYVTRMWWSGGNDDGRNLCTFLNRGIAHPAFYSNWQNQGNLVVDLSDANNICRRL